mmetsp:Transcript_37172/g.32867  ORF Transcript_37172/g.32867 Transcript_37172/m.32867 type:complete len:214 (+) Transcript_37172:152-793(+)
MSFLVLVVQMILQNYYVELYLYLYLYLNQIHIILILNLPLLLQHLPSLSHLYQPHYPISYQMMIYMDSLQCYPMYDESVLLHYYYDYHLNCFHSYSVHYCYCWNSFYFAEADSYCSYLKAFSFVEAVHYFGSFPVPYYHCFVEAIDFGSDCVHYCHYLSSFDFGDMVDSYCYYLNSFYSAEVGSYCSYLMAFFFVEAADFDSVHFEVAYQHID